MYSNWTVTPQQLLSITVTEYVPFVNPLIILVWSPVLHKYLSGEVPPVINTSAVPSEYVVILIFRSHSFMIIISSQADVLTFPINSEPAFPWIIQTLLQIDLTTVCKGAVSVLIFVVIVFAAKQALTIGLNTKLLVNGFPHN